MWWEFAIYIALALVALYLVIWQRPFVKKYWKYLLAAIPVIVVIVRFIAWLVSRKGDGTQSARELQSAIGSIRDQIEEANMEAAVHTAAARAKDQAKIDELKKVMAMKDKSERRKRLAQLVG
jgi:glucan phosphoethanolaminetransferase (alkaline phosphatase superfamily)